MEQFGKEKEAISTLIRNQVTGILMSHSIETPDSGHIKKAVDTGDRVVPFDRVSYDIPDAKIVNDNFQGAYTTAKLLIDQGYKRIGSIAGCASTAGYCERLAG